MKPCLKENRGMLVMKSMNHGFLFVCLFLKILSAGFGGVETYLLISF